MSSAADLNLIVIILVVQAAEQGDGDVLSKAVAAVSLDDAASADTGRDDAETNQSSKGSKAQRRRVSESDWWRID